MLFFKKNRISITLQKLFSLLSSRFRNAIQTYHYRRWIKKYDLLTEEKREEIFKKIAGLDLFSQPKISVVIPVYNTSLSLLKMTINSVRHQLYSHWELCIADDGTQNPKLLHYLETLAKSESNIHVTFSEKNHGISKATNRALALATGDFVAFLDHDDLLTPDALAEMVLAIAAVPEVGYLYSDEDKIDRYGRRKDPFFKPDWNPNLLTSLNYTSHLSLIRRTLITECGGLREGLEGAQDWDLILRVTEKLTPQQIIHIPKILYHWRLSKSSSARSIKAKPYVTQASRNVLEQSLRRRGVPVSSVEQIKEGGHWRVHYALPTLLPLVSIIIMADAKKACEECLKSIQEQTDYSHYEILVVSRNQLFSKSLNKGENIRYVSLPNHAQYSPMNDEIVAQSRGDILVFLNEHLRVIDSYWLGELVAHAITPNVGAVGALVCYPDGLIRHAGLILGMKDSISKRHLAGHIGFGLPLREYVGGNRLNVVQNFSILGSECLAIRRKVYDEINDRNLHEKGFFLGAIELCLMLKEADYKNVWTPFSKLLYSESLGKKRESPKESDLSKKEIKNINQRWSSWIEDDPAYNPNLTLTDSDWSLAWPPRKRSFNLKT